MRLAVAAMPSAPDNPKRGGRPKTGIMPPIGVRLYPEQLSCIDAWIEQQPDQPTRPEAIRRLVEKGLQRG